MTAAILRPLGSTFSQSDSGVIPIPIPFRCLNGSRIVLVFLPFSSAVLLEVLLISLPFSRLLRFNICVVAVAYRGLLLFGIGLVAVAYRGLLLFGIGLVARSGFSLKYRLAFEARYSARCLDHFFRYAQAFNFTSID